MPPIVGGFGKKNSNFGVLSGESSNNEKALRLDDFGDQALNPCKDVRSNPNTRCRAGYAIRPAAAILI